MLTSKWASCTARIVIHSVYAQFSRRIPDWAVTLILFFCSVVICQQIIKKRLQARKMNQLKMSRELLDIPQLRSLKLWSVCKDFNATQLSYVGQALFSCSWGTFFPSSLHVCCCTTSRNRGILEKMCWPLFLWLRAFDFNEKIELHEIEEFQTPWSECVETTRCGTKCPQSII